MPRPNHLMKDAHANDKKASKGTFLRLSKYVLRQWPLFIPAVILTLLSNHLALMGPRFSGAAIDAIELSMGADLSNVWKNLIHMLFCYGLSAIFSYGLSVIMVCLSQKIAYTMRRQVFEKLNRLPVNYFDTHPTGDIISHISYDIDTINSTLSHDLVHVMASVYTVIGSLIFMWQISSPMLIIFAVTLPISILFTRYKTKTFRPLYRKRARLYGELNGFAEEMLSGTRTISAYGRQKMVSKKFSKINNDAMNAYYNAEFRGAALGPHVMLINNISLSLIAIFGGILFTLSIGGNVLETSAFFITLGGVAQFVQYSRKFSGPVNEFANILHEFQSCFSAADRVFKILDEPTEPKDSENATTLTEVKGLVEIENVDFGYVKDKLILKNFSVVAKPGQTVAIVGPTGAGKTTIINLLMRFYDVDSGTIKLDSLPCTEIKREDLRKAYTMVLQDTWLFHGTIFDNIVYGKENATKEEVIAVAKACRIHHFIESLPDGYDTMITDDGVNISKGQRQLITIARAMLSNAPMLILDEATSNVDSRTEIKIQEAMLKLMKNRTCFVIAHRLSTIQNADTILVVKDGQIFEQGNHNSLMAKGGFYSTLYNSQFV